MYGNGSSPAGQNAQRPPAAQVAAIESPLTQVMVAAESNPDGFAVFRNGVATLSGEVDSLSVDIVAPTTKEPDGRVTAIMTSYVTSPDGSRQLTSTPLFPGTVELVSHNKRITVTCQQVGSFDGLWLGLGLRPDGTSSEAAGVQSLRIVVSPGAGIVDAKLQWSDTGATEDLLVDPRRLPA